VDKISLVQKKVDETKKVMVENIGAYPLLACAVAP
jgi:hypothetical protein